MTCSTNRTTAPLAHCQLIQLNPFTWLRNDIPPSRSVTRLNRHPALLEQEGIDDTICDFPGKNCRDFSQSNGSVNTGLSTGSIDISEVLAVANHDRTNLRTLSDVECDHCEDGYKR
jgi:hypothetical protein